MLPFWKPGVVLESILTRNDPAQVFIFQGLVDDEITVEIINDDEVSLGAVIIDEQGQIIAQTVNWEADDSIMIESHLNLQGQYYVTVFLVNEINEFLSD